MTGHDPQALRVIADALTANAHTGDQLAGTGVLESGAEALRDFAELLDRTTTVHTVGAPRSIRITLDHVHAGPGLPEAGLTLTGLDTPGSVVLAADDVLDLQIESGAGALAVLVLREFDQVLAEAATTPDRWQTLQGLRSIAQAAGDDGSDRWRPVAGGGQIEPTSWGHLGMVRPDDQIMGDGGHG